MSNADDLQLFTAIVRRSRDIVAREFPDAEFHVLLWPVQGGVAVRRFEQRVKEALEQQGISVHVLRQLLPDFEREASLYVIPYDLHPSAYAHARAARYVADAILLPGSGIDGSAAP